MIHELKMEPRYFEDVMIRIKTFEIRRNDRNFETGDYLALNEYDPIEKRYSGRALLVRIVYMVTDERFCKKGFVIMGIETCKVIVGDNDKYGFRPFYLLNGGQKNGFQQ